MTRRFAAGFNNLMRVMLLSPELRDIVRHFRVAGRERIDNALEAVASRLPIPLAALKGLAFRATERGDHRTALRLWQEICERSNWSVGVAGRAGALRALNRLDEATEVLHARMARYPDEPIIVAELGWLLLQCNELDEALRIWRRAIVISPVEASCHVGLATTLRQMLSFDEADAVLGDALRKFPNLPFVHTNYAVTADLRGDRPEALSRWQAVHQRFGNEPVAFAGLGAALKALGRFDEADAVLERGMDRFPGDSNVAINHAWIAGAAGDWTEAIRRWTALRAKWPRDPRIKTGYSEAFMHAKLAAADETDDACVSPPIASPDAANDTRNLMMGFESVGENCELGFVQRHFEAEPLGLFRWAGISYDRLLEALDGELDGIGADDNTTLNMNPNNREYYTEDIRYGMTLHSFILEGDAEAATVKAKLCRRIAYLRDKLRDDLRDGGKIFVFNAAEALSKEDLRRLHVALSRYRPVPLLHIAPHADLSVGSVATEAPLLWRGSLGRTGFNGRVWNIEFEAWLTICQRVAQLHAVPREAARV